MFNLELGTTRQNAGVWREVRRACACATVTLLVLAGPAQANWDDKPDAPAKAAEKPAEKEADHLLIQQLLTQIEELEARVHELEAKPLEVAVAAAPSAVASASLPVPGAPPAAAAVPTKAAEPRSADSSDPDGIHMMLLGDVGYSAANSHPGTNTFYLGSLDMFMTGKLSDRVSILSEVLFTSNSDNSVGLDVERMYLKYKQNDYFQILTGRFHTDIGYYNTAYNRGAWFETAIGRPFMYAFDDQGGFLPLQDLGASMSGNIPVEGLRLNYTFEVGNGRTHILGTEPAQNNQDLNNGKAVNFALTSRPHRLPGWQTGFSVYHDNLTTSGNIDHPELIVTGHVVYKGPKYEFLNEVMMLEHKNSFTGAPATYHTPGFYTQLSEQFGKYRPYFRYSFLNAQADEPILGNPANSNDGSVVGRRNGPSVGIRWDFNDHAAVKLQFDRIALRQVGLNTSYDQLATEFSFAF